VRFIAQDGSRLALAAHVALAVALGLAGCSGRISDSSGADTDAPTPGNPDAPGCTTLAQACGNLSVPCIPTWTEATIPVAWCEEAGAQLATSVYVSVECSGYNIASASIFDYSYYFYYSARSGALVGISERTPWGDAGNTCLAGNPPDASVFASCSGNEEPLGGCSAASRDD